MARQSDVLMPTNVLMPPNVLLTPDERAHLGDLLDLTKEILDNNDPSMPWRVAFAMARELRPRLFTWAGQRGYFRPLVKMA